MKVIWRWPCKSCFLLDWLFPMPSVALQSLWASVLAFSVELLTFFFPLRSRDFSWPHFCISLAVQMQMSAIADTPNFTNMLKKFLPSFLVTLERKNCWRCRNSYKCIQLKRFSWGLKSTQMFICTLDYFQFSHILCCSENDILHWRFLVQCADPLQLKPTWVEAAAVSPSPWPTAMLSCPILCNGSGSCCGEVVQEVKLAKKLTYKKNKFVSHRIMADYTTAQAPL